MAETIASLDHPYTVWQRTPSRLASNLREKNKKFFGQMHFYKLFSVLNHSCNPNTFFIYDASANQISIRACKSIRPGDEITLNFISGLFPLESRQLTLNHNFKFFCKCPLCTKADRSLDKLITRWTDLRLTLQSRVSPITKGPQVGEQAEPQSGALDVSRDVVEKVCACERLLKSIGLGNQFVRLDLYKVAVKVLNKQGPSIDKLKIMRKLWVQMRLIQYPSSHVDALYKSLVSQTSYFLVLLSYLKQASHRPKNAKKIKKCKKKKKKKKRRS